jgi:hypothetical protein
MQHAASNAGAARTASRIVVSLKIMQFHDALLREVNADNERFLTN